MITNKENSRNTRKSKRWSVDGIVYESSTQAAKALGVSFMTIQRWCNGYVDANGNKQPSRENCFSFGVYE